MNAHGVVGICHYQIVGHHIVACFISPCTVPSMQQNTIAIYDADRTAIKHMTAPTSTKLMLAVRNSNDQIKYTVT